VTGDQNLFNQQNHAGRKLSLIVLSATKRRLVLAHVEAILGAISRAVPGSYERVQLPGERKGIRAIE
jgi:hypothetical protein